MDADGVCWWESIENEFGFMEMNILHAEQDYWRVPQLYRIIRILFLQFNPIILVGLM